jgi:hypothetical protein
VHPVKAETPEIIIVAIQALVRKYKIQKMVSNCIVTTLTKLLTGYLFSREKDSDINLQAGMKGDILGIDSSAHIMHTCV